MDLRNWYFWRKIQLDHSAGTYDQDSTRSKLDIPRLCKRFEDKLQYPHFVKWDLSSLYIFAIINCPCSSLFQWSSKFTYKNRGKLCFWWLYSWLIWNKSSQSQFFAPFINVINVLRYWCEIRPCLSNVDFQLMLNLQLNFKLGFLLKSHVSCCKIKWIKWK